MTKCIRTKGEPPFYPPADRVQKKWENPTSYGAAEYGVAGYGANDDFTGIYQLRNCKEGKISIKMKLYEPTDTWSQAKQDAQEKFAAAVAGYQILSESEKAKYHEQAIEKHFTGYNLFIREYMLS